VSTTYGALKTRISAVLLDPSGKTFDTATLIPELVSAGLVELGRIAPSRYTEDIDPVANQLNYMLGSSLFTAAEPEIDVMRVEVWDPTTDPDTFIYAINPAGAENSLAGDTGWVAWDGVLTLPTRVVRGLQGYEDTYVVRVWGYAPYAMPTADEDVVPLSVQNEQAVVKFARVEGLELLLSSRDLFTQWQTRSGNSDITTASLNQQLSMARADWRQYSRAISRLRSPV
jgi:hypothetical protein